MANKLRNSGNSEILFWGAPKSLQMVTAAMKLKDACSLVKEETELDSILGQAVNIRLHAWSHSQGTLNFVPSVYSSGIPMENQTPG